MSVTRAQFRSKPNRPRASVKRKPGSYQAHRDRQRQRILDAAQEVFDVKGIDRVTLAEIVKATGVRPMTVYEYFANKDEIVWALVESYFQQSCDFIGERVAAVSGSALVRLTALLDAFGQELSEHPGRVRFQAQFDAMYAREWSVDQLIAIEEKIVPNRSEGLSGLIRQGVADGSLRPDLNPELTIYSIINAAVASQRRLASLGDRVEKEYGQSIHSLFREAMRLILIGVRRNESADASPSLQKRKRVP